MRRRRTLASALVAPSIATRGVRRWHVLYLHVCIARVVRLYVRVVYGATRRGIELELACARTVR